jgi:hypothetical protein
MTYSENCPFGRHVLPTWPPCASPHLALLPRVPAPRPLPARIPELIPILLHSLSLSLSRCCSWSRLPWTSKRSLRRRCRSWHFKPPRLQLRAPPSSPIPSPSRARTLDVLLHYTTAQTGVQLRVAKSIEIALDGRSLYICGKRSDAICYCYVRRLVGIFILDQRPTVGRNNWLTRSVGRSMYQIGPARPWFSPFCA